MSTDSEIMEAGRIVAEVAEMKGEMLRLRSENDWLRTLVAKLSDRESREPIPIDLRYHRDAFPPVFACEHQWITDTAGTHCIKCNTVRADLPNDATSGAPSRGPGDTHE